MLAVRVEFRRDLYETPEVAYSRFRVGNSRAVVEGLLARLVGENEAQLGSCFVAHPDFLPSLVNTKGVRKISVVFVVFLQTLCHQNLAEREGFEPSIQVLARITV